MLHQIKCFFEEKYKICFVIYCLLISPCLCRPPVDDLLDDVSLWQWASGLNLYSAVGTAPAICITSQRDLQSDKGTCQIDCWYKWIFRHPYISLTVEAILFYPNFYLSIYNVHLYLSFYYICHQCSPSLIILIVSIYRYRCSLPRQSCSRRHSLIIARAMSAVIGWDTLGVPSSDCTAKSVFPS